MEPRTARLGLGLVAVGTLLGALLPSPLPPPAAPSADEAGWEVSYARTDLALHTNAPIVPGRNVVWCATIQLAWDELADVLGEGGRLELAAPPQAVAAAAALNGGRFPREAIDEASYVALAGLVRDGVLSRIEAAWRERFPDAGEPPAIEAGPADVVAFAALQKDLPFETPFRVHPGWVPFGDTGVGVRTFGMIRDDQAPDIQDMARQVAVYDGVGDEGETVVELLPEGGQDRILLSSLPPGATLETAWGSAAERMRRGPREVLEDAVEMVLPRIRMDLERHFPALEAATVAHKPDARITEVRQRIEFGLSERGAILKSFAMAVGSIAASQPIRFDRPFLLSLLRAGATRPYFLLWVGNEDLLDRSAPEAPSPAVLRPFVGAWKVETERSIAHNRMLATGSGPSSNDRRGVQEELQRVFRPLEVEVGVAADGNAVVRVRHKPWEVSAEPRPWKTTRGRVMVLEGRPVFVPAVPPRDPALRDLYEDDSDPTAPWPLEVAGRLIRVRIPDIWVVLERAR